MKKLNKVIFVLLLFTILFLNNINVYAISELSVNANASLIIELNSGKIIHEDNINEIIYPASTTKILTAILVLENCSLDEKAIVSKNAVSNLPDGYVVAPLFAGEEMRIEDLLYALMLKSANDAAYVLAEHVGGSVEAFADMMNKKASELGCKNSNFVNPNGIHNENHYSTAYDLFLISKYAMKNKEFVKIVSTYSYVLPSTNKYSSNDRIMENTNEFINPDSDFFNENVRGIKTGTTTQAGNCLITDVSKDGFEIITVVLGAKTSNSKFSETSKMIDYMFDNYTYTEIHKKGDIIKNIDVEKATKETKNLNIIISNDIIAMNNVNIDPSMIEPEIALNENIIAPIYKGQELGTIKYTVDGLEYNAKLLAETDVFKKTYYGEILIGSGAFLLVLGLILIIFAKKRKKHKLRLNRR